MQKLYILALILIQSVSTLFSQNLEREEQINELINKFYAGQQDSVIPVLETFLLEEGLPDNYYPHISCLINSYYFQKQSNKLDYVTLNKIVDRYLASGECLKDSIIIASDYYILRTAAFLNGDNLNYNKQLEYLTFLEDGYKNLSKNEESAKYYQIISAIVLASYEAKKADVGLQFGDKAIYLSKKILPHQDDNRIFILYYVGKLNALKNNNTKALEYFQNSIKIAEDIYNENPKELIAYLKVIEEDYFNMELDNEVIGIIEKIVNITGLINVDNYTDEYLMRLELLSLHFHNTMEFRKALPYNLQIVKINKKNYGEFHLKYLESLHELAQLYSKVGEYQKSIETYQEVSIKRKKILGDKHPDYLASLNNLASAYAELGDFKKSLEINKEIVRLRKEIQGESHRDYLISLSNLALNYSDLGNFNESLRITTEVGNKQKKVLGETHPDYLNSLNNLSVLYAILGDNYKSLKISSEIIVKQKEVLGEYHPEYLSSLSNLAVTYYDFGDYKKALKLIQEVITKRKEILGDLHPDYLTSLSNLAQIYSDLGDLEKSLELNLEVVRKLNEVYEDFHPDYLTSRSNLATVYSDLGDYYKALKINQEVAKIRKETLGSSHPDYLISLHNLANSFGNIGDYNKALELQIEVVNKQKELFGEKHPQYLLARNNLASTYSNLGDYNKYLEINLEVVKISKQLGTSNTTYLTSLSNLASAYYKLGDYNKAIELFNESTKGYKNVFDENHSSYLTSLNNLAVAYSGSGEYNKAMEISQKVEKKRKEVLGSSHPDYLTSLNNLSVVYSETGNYNEAIELKLQLAQKQKEILGDDQSNYLMGLNNLAVEYLNIEEYKKALKIIRNVVIKNKDILGNYHPRYLTSLSNLAQSEALLNHYELSSKHFFEVLNKRKERVIDYFSMMTEHQRMFFRTEMHSTFEYAPFYLSQNQTSEYTGEIYNASLFIKGLLLNTTQDFEALIQEKGSPEAIATFNELKRLKFHAQKLEEQPIKKRYLSLDSLQDVIQIKEMELVKLSAEYGEYTNNLKISWKDVQSKLKKNEVAIEFVEYPTLSDTVKYAALVLRKNWSAPKMVSLFQKDQLEKRINSTPDSIYSNTTTGKTFKELIWKPLEGYIDMDEKVYFSASGLLYKIAIENLPVNDSMTIGDSYSLYRLSSTKELVHTKKK